MLWHLTQDGSWTAIHSQSGQAYHSLGGAKKETEDLFLKSSGLAEKWKKPNAPPVKVLDVGLGLGYNALTTAAFWWLSPQPQSLEICSLERERTFWETEKPFAWWSNHPLEETFKRLKNGHEVLGHKDEDILSWYHPTGAKGLWRFLWGDAHSKHTRRLLEKYGPWDYIWHDPFSPEINPEMWTTEWFQTLNLASKSTTLLMTYSVAGSVKRNLNSAGWAWEKIPSTTGKKSWLKAKPLSGGDGET